MRLSLHLVRFPRWMAAPRIRRGWVEAGLVGVAGADCLLHCVIDFEDDALGTVIAVELFLIPALHDGEGVHDIVRLSRVKP